MTAESLSPDETTPGTVQLRKAQRALGLAAQAARADGQLIPCMQDGPNLWLSERANQRRWAAKLCQGCPLIAECEAVAVAIGDPYGVWAAVDHTDRRTVRVRTQSSEQRARIKTAEALRQERQRAELAASDDPRVMRLREYASQPHTRYRRPSPEVERLVAELALSDPASWTYERLAVAAGMSSNGAKAAVRRVLNSDSAA